MQFCKHKEGLSRTRDMLQNEPGHEVASVRHLRLVKGVSVVERQSPLGGCV